MRLLDRTLSRYATPEARSRARTLLVMEAILVAAALAFLLANLLYFHNPVNIAVTLGGLLLTTISLVLLTRGRYEIIQ